ncbi:hypothetical protein FOZ62_032206 [Perkinsus olseni]|uniref:Uncharacterized protein n=1 Tax=Perkinsus olseni TaxID=32597 RepID=A0A7J6RU04_PEROL|nr:hypothetical protein FOZ62_032206 [Perkinsus olseni]
MSTISTSFAKSAQSTTQEVANVVETDDSVTAGALQGAVVADLRYVDVRLEFPDPRSHSRKGVWERALIDSGADSCFAGEALALEIESLGANGSVVRPVGYLRGVAIWLNDKIRVDTDRIYLMPIKAILRHNDPKCAITLQRKGEDCREPPLHCSYIGTVDEVKSPPKVFIDKKFVVPTLPCAVPDHLDQCYPKDDEELFDCERHVGCLTKRFIPMFPVCEKRQFLPVEDAEWSERNESQPLAGTENMLARSWEVWHSPLGECPLDDHEVCDDDGEPLPLFDANVFSAALSTERGAWIPAGGDIPTEVKAVAIYVIWRLARHGSIINKMKTMSHLHGREEESYRHLGYHIAKGKMFSSYGTGRGSQASDQSRRYALGRLNIEHTAMMRLLSRRVTSSTKSWESVVPDSLYKEVLDWVSLNCIASSMLVMLSGQ